MDNQSITHTRWNCTYHIVFIPKYRRKIMYGETKKDLVAIIKKLCEMKQVDLIDGRVCKDHIHMYVEIPPKISVSEFMSYLNTVYREKREEAFGKTYISPVDDAIRDQRTMETLTKNSRNHIISMRREQHG